jgi:hypothetical protein
VAIASLFSALFTSSRLPSFLEIFVSRPIAITVVLLIMSLVASAFLRMRFDVILGDCVRFVPMGLMIGLVLSLIGIWNDGSGTTALRLSDAGLFALTFGIIPLKLGPEILLRGSIAALVFLFAFHLHKQNTKPSTIAKVFFASWIGGASVLLVQTWMAHWSALTNQLTIYNSQDAIRALGLLNMNSYWSTFQADRFFAGIEKQLDTSVALSSAGLVFLFGIAALIVVAVISSTSAQRKDFARFIKDRLPSPMISVALVASPLVGIVIGWRASRWSWNALDFIAVLILCVLAASWLSWNFFSESELLPILILLAGFLLGWPVFFLVLSLFALKHLVSDSCFMSSTKFGSSMEYCLNSAILIVMGGVFIARNALFPKTIGYWAIGIAFIVFFIDQLQIYRKKAPRP